jgi:hypothetical protein
MSLKKDDIATNGRNHEQRGEENCKKVEKCQNFVFEMDKKVS